MAALERAIARPVGTAILKVCMDPTGKLGKETDAAGDRRGQDSNV
jgi:hypothetical protein